MTADSIPAAAGGQDSVWKSLLPAVQTATFVAIAAIAYQALSFDEPAEASVPLVATKEWLIWKATAALGQATAVSLFLVGVAHLWRMPDRGVGKRVVVVQGLVAGLFVLLVTWFVADLLSASRPWPIPGMEERLDWVVRIATASAAPWIALVWIGHRLLRKNSQHTVKDLMATWDLIVSCALAFGLFVVVALLPTGALRNLWLATATGKKDRARLAELFSSADVLLYGALYGGLIVVIVVPLVLSWRTAARELLEAHHPPETWIDENAWAARERLEKLLNLDVAPIRNPLTVFTILTPLVTSALAAFLPDIGE